MKTTKTRSIALDYEGEAKEWLDNQVNGTASINRALQLIRARYGVGDLPTTLANENLSLESQIHQLTAENEQLKKLLKEQNSNLTDTEVEKASSASTSNEENATKVTKKPSLDMLSTEDNS